MEERAEKKEAPMDYWKRHDRKLRVRSTLIFCALGTFMGIAIARFQYKVAIPSFAIPSLAVFFVALWRWISSRLDHEEGEE